MRWNKLLVVTAMLATWYAFLPAAADATTNLPDSYLQPTMSVSRARSLSSSEARRMIAAIAPTGAVGHIVKFPTVGLTAQVRDGVDILRLGNGWRIPMATMVAPVEYLRAVGGDALAEKAALGTVLIGEKAAAVRGAHVGDVLTLRDVKFRKRNFVIAAIVSNDFVDYGDLFMTSESAVVLGDINIARVTITNIPSPKVVLTALASKGFVINSSLRLRTSWERENPDETLGTSTVKTLLGEFAFRPTNGTNIQVDSVWSMKNILWRFSFQDVGLRSSCHKVVVAAIQNALTEIRATGLASKINVQNSNRYGGCFTGRYNRMAGTFGAPSRHSYGMALDINTVTNAQGATPQMDCRVVRIFRKWGFAWGGNFWPADGMHFEYVGLPREKIGYPSRYCPNNVPIPTTTLPTFGATTSTSSTTTTSSSSTTSTISPSTTTTVAVTSTT